MRCILKMILSIFVCFGVFLSSHSLTFAQESIQKYDIDVHILDTGHVEVREEIVYDFGLQQRHGIYRTIPFRFDLETTEGNKTFELGIDSISVTDNAGNSYMYSDSTSSGELTLKIGDPNSTISGAQTYVISYTLSGALRYFTDHDELYLNAIGQEWTVPINNIDVRVTFPESAENMAGPSSEQFRSVCYVGPYGSREESCTVTKNESNLSVSFEQEALKSNEVMSIVVSMPKGLVAELYPAEYVSFEETLLGKIFTVVAILLAGLWYVVLPIWVAFRWYKYGRDPDVGVAPTAHFDAPQTSTGRELTPAETGVLIDETVQRRDILSTVVDLARRGHLKIVEKKKKDFYFEKDIRGEKNEKVSELQNFEVKLLTDIFEKEHSVRLKDAKLVSTLVRAEEMLYESMVSNGFIKKNPKSTRTIYEVLAVFSLISANFPLLFSSLIFGRIMPKKTVFGEQQANKAKGLYSFLKSQERQLNFEGEDPQVMFEKLLPYAVAFGVEKQWMERFKDINLEQPEWYVSSRPFNQANMMSGMQSSFSSFNKAVTPASSSSGFSSSGGFSGGGVGGGGGGSW